MYCSNLERDWVLAVLNVANCEHETRNVIIAVLSRVFVVLAYGRVVAVLTRQNTRMILLKSANIFYSLASYFTLILSWLWAVKCPHYCNSFSCSDIRCPNKIPSLECVIFIYSDFKVASYVFISINEWRWMLINV